MALASSSLSLGKNMAFLSLVCLFAAGATMAAVKKVGDSQGWTVGGKVNYTIWSSNNIINSGDTLVFQYDPKRNNVLQVSKPDYDKCSTVAPMNTYTSGYDRIVLHQPGLYYYICGIGKHCIHGQKVDIRVDPKDTP